MKFNHKIPSISIIIPVYNTGLYLTRCLDSALNQSIKSKEIIVVDDLSTDNSSKIIYQYASKYKEIKCFKMKKRGGAGGARNLGLSKASAKYIGFIDSDDWIDTNMYEKMVSQMEVSKAEIGVCSVMTEYSSKYEAIPRYYYEIGNVLEGKFALELLCRRFNQDTFISPIVCNKVYLSKFIKQYGISFSTNIYNEDDIFNFISFLNAAKVVITPNTFYHYFQRSNSITHSFSKKHLDDLVKAFTIIKKYLERSGNFSTYRNQYYSFFEKCFSFVLEMLINSEHDTAIQNKYLNHLFSRANYILPLESYLSYMGARRLRSLLNPVPIK